MPARRGPSCAALRHTRTRGERTHLRERQRPAPPDSSDLLSGVSVGASSYQFIVLNGITLEASEWAEPHVSTRPGAVVRRGALCPCSDGKRLGFTSVLDRYNIVSEGDVGQAADRLAHYLGSQPAKAGDFPAGPLATETRQGPVQNPHTDTGKDEGKASKR
jgi:hypothetical protein